MSTAGKNYRPNKRNFRKKRRKIWW